jgi:nitrogen regulatory protein PII
MTPVKRIEIVADSLGVPALLRELDRRGVSGYTVIRDATGRGERGVRAGDELTGALKNSYILIACHAHEVDGIIAAVRPVLERAGGIALVSDALWVVH